MRHASASLLLQTPMHCGKGCTYLSNGSEPTGIGFRGVKRRNHFIAKPPLDRLIALAERS